MFQRFNIRSPHFALTVLMAFYLVNGIFYLRAQSLTSDEASFFDYAKRFVSGHPERIDARTDNSKMPVSVLNIIPRAVQQVFNPALKKNDEGMSDIMMGRVVTLMISALTIGLVYRWTKQLYGRSSGLFTAFLVSFCPNLIASAGLVTTDAYSALFLLATMYALWKFCNDRRRTYFILLSVLVALSQLVKQSLFHLYLIIPICLLLNWWSGGRKLVWKKVILYSALFIVINIFVINLGYYFTGINTRLGAYHFTSDLFSIAQLVLPKWLPIPLPRPMIIGLDMAKYYDQIGGGTDGVSSFGKVTILDRSFTGKGVWYYYLVSLFFKTPIPYLILIFWAVAKLRIRESFFYKEMFLLVPVLYFLIYMSFAYKTQCGIRHIIFIFPLLFIFCGSIFLASNKWLIGVLSLWLVCSVLRYWSNYYPYTNEFIWKKRFAYQYVGASNLEFQQGGRFAAAYIRQHPEVRMATRVPGQGLFLINTSDYLDIWNRHQFDWISGIKPSGQVAYNWLLIKVSRSHD